MNRTDHIGGGGREHALAWKVAQSPNVDTVYVAPGNAGTARKPGIENVALDVMDFEAWQTSPSNNVGLTIVGPEAPLVDGVVDYFQARDLRCFGPSKGAAQLEGSKAFTKDFLARHNIPTAAYGNFTELEPALAYLREQGAPIVVKADGLAAGKGVIVAETLEQAEDAVTDMLSGNAFGDAGCRVVIEEFLDGRRSQLYCHGRWRARAAHGHQPGSQTHRRRRYRPQYRRHGRLFTRAGGHPDVHKRIMEQVILPTVRGMAAEGNAYTGFLYAGLMISADGQPRGHRIQLPLR